MKKSIIGFFVLIIIIVGFILKSKIDRDDRVEAQANRIEEYIKKMVQMEPVKKAKFEEDGKDKINKEQASLSDEKYRENSNISLAEAAVKIQLFDPESAKFRNQKNNCGEVNFKNKFGGYVGYSRYVFLTNDNMVAIENNKTDSIWSASAMNDLWSKYCN